MSRNLNNNSAIKRDSYIWNAAFYGVNAVQPAIMLLAVSRAGSLEEAGMVGIGFAFANALMILGRYGLHNFQVTDVEEQYSFRDYFACRVISVGMAAAIALLYLFACVLTDRYTGHKAMIIMELVILRLIDAFEDVFIGRLQQKGRLDIGARVGTVRQTIIMAVIFLAEAFSGNLAASLLAGIVTSIAVEAILLPFTDRYASYSLDFGKGSNQSERFMKTTLLIAGAALCIGTFLHNVLGNMTKYLIDFYLTDAEQAINNYLMLPVFVVTLMNYVLMQPAVKSIGDLWSRRETNELRRMIIRHVLVLIFLAGIITAGVLILGLQILSWMYQVPLTRYRGLAALLMLGGLIYTISEYFMMLLVVLRRQRVIVIGCISALITGAGLSVAIVPGRGLYGTAFCYIAASLVMLSSFLVTMPGMNRDV